MAAIEYFLYVKGIEIGPFDLLYVRNKLRKNEVNPDVFMKSRRGANWQPLYDVLPDEVSNWPAPFGYQDVSKRPPLPGEPPDDSAVPVDDETLQKAADVTTKAESTPEKTAPDEEEPKNLPMILTVVAAFILMALGGIFLYFLASPSSPQATSGDTTKASSSPTGTAALPATLLGTYLNDEAQNGDTDSILKNRNAYTIVLQADQITVKVHGAGETITYAGRYLVTESTSMKCTVTATLDSPRASAPLAFTLNLFKDENVAFLRLSDSNSSLIKLTRQN